MGQVLGGIRFSSYLPKFAKATIRIEDPSSPLAKELPASFVIDKEEWYTGNPSPRPTVRALATDGEGRLRARIDYGRYGTGCRIFRPFPLGARPPGPGCGSHPGRSPGGASQDLVDLGWNGARCAILTR